VLGEAAVAAGRTNTFLGERYRRIARRRGAKRAIVAVGRSILIIVWHLLSDPTVGYQDLGPGFYDTRINAERRKRTTSANSKRSATRSPSNPLPDLYPSPCQDPAPLRCAGCCRLPTHRQFSDQDLQRFGRPVGLPGLVIRAAHPISIWCSHLLSLACSVDDAVNVLRCATCAYLNGRLS
jgi:hypothetical protein